MAGNSHPNRTGGDPPSRGRGPSDHLSSSALAHQPPPPNMAVDSHPNRPGGDSPSRGRDRDRGSLTSPPRFLNTGKSKNPACNDAAVVVRPRGGGRLASPPRFPGTGTGKGKQSETAGAAFSRGRGGPSPPPPFVDKGKQVASEQETPTPSTGFMQDARRGFMADARRAAQPRTAPRPLLASGSTALPPNRSDRGDTTTNFTLRPLGSTVKKPFILDNKIYSKLKHHQKEGLKWLWAIHCCGNGGLLADDMGLGKTFQILAFIAGLIESKLMERAIIAVPAMILDQWVVEMEGAGLKNYIHIFKDIKTRKLEIMKVCQNGGILITTHTLATNKWSMLNISWDYLFIDEAHQTCKKTSLKAYRNLERLECKRRILITGTPAPNSLKEFRAILNFCCPGLFDCMTEFHDSYLAPLVEGNYKDSSPDQLNESSKASKKLQHLIRPCFLRRLKSVLSSVETPEKIRLTLPEKVEFVLWLKLSRYQEKLYRTFLSGDIIDKSNQGEAIVASTVLHKICNHPKNLSNINEDGLDDKERAVLRRMVRKLSSSITRGEDNMSEDPASCKIDIILRLMERFKEQKHKVLIFSHTCEMLDTVEEVLLKKGYLLDRIDGTLNQKVRAKRVQSFQKADGAPILLISSFCAGTGLDLPAASRAIIIEPFWNPSVDDQCADRIYRLSQEKNCIIYRLISSETIEEVVYRTQIFKLGVFKTATENKDFKRYITRKLRNELLAISPNGFGSSRTLQQLEKESTSTLSQEMNEEMNFLKKGDLIGVSIHSELFQGAPIRKTNIPAASFAPNERIRDLDYAEELRKAAHRRKVEFVEDQIKKYNYTYMTTRSTLPDQGAKCLRMVDRYTKELAELRSSTDPKDNT